ncbi:MAG: hypothetical protein P8X74_10215 [Reinekea sp.]
MKPCGRSLTGLLGRSLLILLLPALSLSYATEPEQTEMQQNRCASDVVKAELDSEIQAQLNNLYNQDGCFQQEVESLTDGVVGDVTKKWIHNALSDHLADNAASSEPEAVYSGVQPVILLADDLTELALNREVIELMTALAQDDEKNRFLTHTEAEAAIQEDLSGLKDINEALLDRYLTLFKPMIVTVTEKTLTQPALDALAVAGHVDAADAVKGLVGEPQDAAQFDMVVENTLVQKIVSEDNTATASDSSGVAADVTKLEKKTDAEFKSKIAEIAAQGEDTESLIKKLLEFGQKINPVGKDFKALKEAKAARKIEAEKELAKLMAQGDNSTAAVDEDSSYEIAKAILLNEIKKHEKSAIKLNKKGKTDEANKETFIANELKQIFFDELDRIKDNEVIEKVNAEKAKEQEKAEALAKAAAAENEEIAAATEELKKTDVMNIINENTDSQLRYKLVLSGNLATLLPSLDTDIATCVQNLVDVSYVSRHSFEKAVLSILTSLDEVSYNMANPENMKDVQPFSCTVEKTVPENYFIKSGAEAVLVDKAVKAYKNRGLINVDIAALDGCTQCTEPLKGLSYGFYPFWQASHEYRQLGLPIVNPARLDFSVFSNIAYFGLTIDDEGKIQDKLHLGNTQQMSQFFSTLTTYNVERDIVIYTNNWQHWSDASASTDSENNIKRYAEDHYQVLSDINDEYDEYGGISGVTFYLDHYAASADVSSIINYLKYFKAQMGVNSNGKTSPQFTIRLMLGIEGFGCENLTSTERKHLKEGCRSVEVGQSIQAGDPNYFLKLQDLFIGESGAVEGKLTAHEITNLVSGKHQLFGNKSADSAIVSDILVVLNEGTSKYKKALRTQIENEFSGGTRVQALLSIVPVLGRVELKEHGVESMIQFQDDIAYLKYNFGGMGLWNLPYTGVDEEGQQLETNPIMTIYAQLLKLDYGDNNRNYVDRPRMGMIGQLLTSNLVSSKVDVCGEVCPKRTLYVRIFIGTMILNGILSILWRTNCAARTLIKCTRPVRETTLMGSLLLFLALLGCHPEWQQFSPQILSACVAFIISNLMYRFFSNSYEQSDET